MILNISLNLNELKNNNFFMNFVQKVTSWVKEKYSVILNEFSSKNKETPYKIFVMGEEGVGKTSFCNRYINNQFNLEIKPSLSQSKEHHFNKKLFEDIVLINLVDVSSNILSSEHVNFYSNAKGAFILYDITEHKTFDKIDTWVMDLRQLLGSKFPIVIVGNKNDLSFLKTVHPDEIKEKAANLNCDYGEVSCTNLSDVQKIVDFLITKIYFLNLPENRQNYFLQVFK